MSFMDTFRSELGYFRFYKSVVSELWRVMEGA